MGFSLRLFELVVSTGSGLNFLGDVCCAHASAYLCRLLRAVVSIGSGAKRRLVFSVVSIGVGSNFRLLFFVVSTGSGANRRGAGFLASVEAGLSFRFVFDVVSTGSGANLRTGFVFSILSFRSFDDLAVVSIGSTLNRLGA